MTPRDVVEFKEVDCQGAVLVLATTLPSVRIWWIGEELDQGAVHVLRSVSALLSTQPPGETLLQSSTAP